MNAKKCEETLNCEFCETNFTDQDSLQQHLKLHSRRKPYKCDECEAKFSYNSTLEWHKKSHMGELPFQCNECGAQFHQNSILVWHKRKHMTGETSHANTAQTIVVNVTNIYPSQQNSSPDSSVFCVPDIANAVTSTVNNSIHSTCDTTSSPSFSVTTTFPSSSTQVSELVVDNIGKRKFDEEGRFQCDACGQVFQRSGDLRAHVQTKHNVGKNNPYYILAKQQEVTGHFITRKKIMTEKPFKCDLCMAGFNTEGHLRTHRQNHITGRPFKCSKCLLSFSDKLTLDSHERRHQQADRPHKCNHCGATFYRETHLQRHIKRHTGELV